MLIISDASVLIDIEHGKLTRAMFDLPFQYAIPDTLFVEELLEHHGHLSKFSLIIKTMGGDLLEEAYRLHLKYIKTSVNDMLALVLSKHENCQLLTSDKALSKPVTPLNNADLGGLSIYRNCKLLFSLAKKNTLFLLLC